LVEQLRDFPCGEFDEAPDALEAGFRLACELLALEETSSAAEQHWRHGDF
jgi:hypothetical protein